MQTSLDLIRFGAHFGKASISHPVLVICDQPATNPRLQGCKGDPTHLQKRMKQYPHEKRGASLDADLYLYQTNGIRKYANITFHRIYRSLGAADGETRTDPGMYQRDVSGVSSSRWMTRSWISGGGGLSCKWCQGGLWTMTNLLLHLMNNRLLFSYKLYRYLSHVCFFPAYLSNQTLLPWKYGPWHDRFSRSKGQSDVPKFDQWPPRQPPKEVLMLTHLRASVLITTCCVHMLFYVDLKASGVRTSESTLVLPSRQNEDMSWNVYANASNVDHLIFDIKHCNKS